MWSEKCDSDLFFAEIVWSDSFSWSCLIISSSVFLTRQVSSLTNDACSFSIIEWRMPVLDLSSDVYNETSSLTRHFIKLEKSDSSNLTKATHQTWWVKTSFHQIWRKRLIKLDDVISLSRTNASSHQTFEKKDSFFIFWWTIFCSDTWWKKLSLAENHLLCEDCCDKWAFLKKAERWYNSAFFL
jgi:hypothetical protein